jgi:aryl-alcohol dehydrogenase-like predicted oxidoreductase
MQTRTLGNSASGSTIQIVPLVFGGNVFGWTADEARSFDLLDAFVDRGFNCIDTADVYSSWVPDNSGGESETILGKWFARSGKRDKVVLATKVGMDFGQGKGLSRQHILSAVEASLKRLQTDTIDLYQSHKDDPGTPIDETLEAYAQLIQQGKVRMIGASNFSADRTREAVAAARAAGLPVYQTLQPEYNLYDRQSYEQELAPVAAELGLGVIPYFSLASGFLTGKYQSEADAKGAKRESRVAKYFNPRGMAILRPVPSRPASRSRGCSRSRPSPRPSLAPPRSSSSTPSSPPSNSSSPTLSSSNSPKPAPTKHNNDGR